MTAALAWGLGCFVACWCVHWAVWRVRVPHGYLIWLPAIFVLLPAVVVASSWGLTGVPQGEQQWTTFVAAAYLHLALGGCYTCGYAGVAEYSPSAEILFAVDEAMPAGAPIDALRVRSFREYDLVGKRIDDLVESGMIVARDDRWVATSKGRRSLALCRGYRVLFGVAPVGHG